MSSGDEHGCFTGNDVVSSGNHALRGHTSIRTRSHSLDELSAKPTGVARVMRALGLEAQSDC